jgi:hydrogenase maturation protein HypF
VVRTLLRVTGTVQGVGFRPFVYRHAVALGLVGTVRNDSEGVLIDVEGDPAGVAALERVLTESPPPLARVASVEARPVAPDGERDDFRIVETDAVGPLATAVSIDTAACDDCLAEVDDPGDRRYRYPFTNCTNCGPRYTITLLVPYDRPTTTMAGFAMCARCRAEYDDPGDRRFHAQPNACPDCGPRASWRDAQGVPRADGDDALDAAVAALASGAIVGVKGIGGFHLAVRADDEDRVAELRRRKARDDKPFALMVADVTAADAVGVLDDRARAVLTSPARPIVIAPRRDVGTIAPSVAPGSPDLGVFLPYSPLHHLLVRGVGAPLVMTSGNRSDDPIAHDDADAVARLGPLVDAFLTHDRPIHIRCDDSVVRATPRRVQVLRRSRGYAPEPLRLPGAASRAVLAVGGELKCSIAVTREHDVVAGHHLGDLEHLATYESFLQSLAHLPALYGVSPEVVAHDLHPEYLSSKLARDLDVPTVAVQHHHAHVAACMVEHERRDPVVALAFDGLGYGPDGTLWGGEVLVAGFDGFERVGHLRSVPMPGGAAAIREPWRMATVWGELATGDAIAVRGVDPARVADVRDLAGRPSTLTTTSMGRLFDAVAVLLGGRTSVSYEAQAAIELEWSARRAAPGDRLDRTGLADLVSVVDGDGGLVLDPGALVARLVAERRAGTDVAVLSAGFHDAIGRAAVRVAAEIARTRGIDAVVLTGGVFQNTYLTEVVECGLAAEGLRTLVHARVPPNDGGLSIGQAAIAALGT